MNDDTFEQSFEGDTPNKDEQTFFPDEVDSLFTKSKGYNKINNTKIRPLVKTYS